MSGTAPKADQIQWFRDRRINVCAKLPRGPSKLFVPECDVLGLFTPEEHTNDFRHSG
jgi:hypothetical protein